MIWQYNRSDAYIDTVLTLYRQIESPRAAERNPRVAKNDARRRTR